MSRYADLRWKIEDLEKKIEEEKIINRRLNEDLRMKYFEIHEKDKEIAKRLLRESVSKCLVQTMDKEDNDG